MNKIKLGLCKDCKTETCRCKGYELFTPSLTINCDMVEKDPMEFNNSIINNKTTHKSSRGTNKGFTIKLYETNIEF